MNQTKDIQTQLGKMRDQISGVSIDEETANLLQFQHAFDASAKLIQIADECLDTVMSIKR
jgi:flagellar hook-associated protein 1 FlgK